MYTNATHLFVHQQLQRHAQQIASWGRRVASMQSLESMAREATHPPTAPSVVRAFVQGAEQRHAEHAIGRAMIARVQDTDDIRALCAAQRLVQGRYPEVARAIQTRLAHLA